jgi:integrase
MQFRIGTKPDGTGAYATGPIEGAVTKDDARKEVDRIEAAIAQTKRGDSSKDLQTDVGVLLGEWRDQLTNRAAYQDGKVINRDLIPEFKGLTIKDATLPVVIAWMRKIKASDMAPQTQRHRLGLLSRFFSWAIVRGIADTNPVRMIPQRERPAAKRLAEAPCLEDDSMVPKLMAELGPNLGLIFYLARFSGMREGEAAGLRIADLDTLGRGYIVVRGSFSGPLKEDRKGTGTWKKVPAPADAVKVLQAHLKRRKRMGAKSEDLVFPYQRPATKRPGRKRTSEWAAWAGFHPKEIRSKWRVAARRLGLPDDLTFYGATRHTWATKSLLAGASLEEVSRALGHATTEITKRTYIHIVRERFSPALRQGLGGNPPARGNAAKRGRANQ